MSEKPAHYGKQPEPVGNGVRVIDYVISDLLLRQQAGKEKYGTVLRTHNGRSALMDAYQEALDLCMYLKQALIEEDLRRDDGK